MSKRIIVLLFFICCLLAGHCYVNEQHVYPQTILISHNQGVDDYSAIIQEALNLKPERIVFGPGNYSFSNVAIKGNVEIVADGDVVFHPVSVPQAFEETGLHMYQSMFVANNVDSITLKDIKFIGNTTNTVISSGFKTSTYYSGPIVFFDNAKYVSVSGCLFNNIEGCSCCSNGYTYYGNKKGLLLCLYDVDDFWFDNNEISSCRHDEQVWSIAVKKERKRLTVHFINNYIHDEKPSVDSSVFSCVAGNVFVRNNLIERFHYKGSIFNLFGTVVYAENNTAKDSYATSVFDTSEYGYFFTDSVIVRNNKISVLNSQMIATHANYIECSDNVFEGISMLVSENQPVASKSRYSYFYQKESPKFANSNVIIERNICDFTHYDPSLSILWPERYASGIFIMPYYNIGRNITIKNNVFQSFSAGANNDKSMSFSCNTMKIANMNNIVVEDNIIKGSWYHPKSSKYTTPIVIEMETRNFPNCLDKYNSFANIGSICIRNNKFEPNSSNCTVLSIGRTFNKEKLRIGKLVINQNRGNVAAPVLYDSFADEIIYDGIFSTDMTIPRNFKE